MGLLRNVVDGSIRRPGCRAVPADLELPVAWDKHLSVLADATPEEALAWCWCQPEHDRLAEYDSEFEIQVRRALCIPPLRQELVPCR